MGDKQPLVSVIVPTRNSAATLERCLESVQAQSYPNLEIIVVDNHSQDRTVEIASSYASVYTFGPERSAQVNFGARQANGEYLYRIDSDFVLDPGVVEACVRAAESDGISMVAVPNRSIGRTYWSRVRALERDTYLDDELIVAARFIRKSAFLEVGGFDETLSSCEDYDLHNRLIAQGYGMQRVTQGELHLGEPDRLWDYAKKSFYYGPSAWRYVRKHTHRGIKQMLPLRGSFVRHWRTIISQPSMGAGLVILKIVQYASAGIGILSSELGLSDDRGRFVPAVWASLALVLAGLWGLGQGLDRFATGWTLFGKIMVLLIALILWQVVARRHSLVREVPLSEALPATAFAFLPMLPALVLGGALGLEVWMFVFSLGVAFWIAWLVFFVGGNVSGRIWVPSAAMLLGVSFFILVFVNNAWRSLRLLNFSAFDLALFDQALWRLAQGEVTSLPSLLYSSIIPGSVFVNTPAPILLIYTPLYYLGIGGPMLLMTSQVIALGLSAYAIYYLAREWIKPWPAFLVACAFMVYFTTIRAGVSNFDVQSLAAPGLIFAAAFSWRKQFHYYYPMIIFVWICGVTPSLAVAGLGLYLLVFRQERVHGAFTIILSLVWVWTLAFALVPLFGGEPGGGLAMLFSEGNQPLGTRWMDALTRPFTWRYLVLLLAPLAFTPFLGVLFVLPAAFPLLFNLITSSPAELAFPGTSPWLITPFLFLAAAFGLTRVSKFFRIPERISLYYAGSALLLVGCILTSSFMVPDVVREMFKFRIPTYYRHVDSVISEVSSEQSLSTQSALAVRLSHRSDLQILPRAEGADAILFDINHPNREPEPDLYEESLWRAYRNPEYGLRYAEAGFLLFERGLDPDEDLHKLALRSPLEADYRLKIVLDDKVAYRGFSLPTRQVRAQEPFLLTHYWECLTPLDRPYLIFTAYPGGRRFEQAVYGLYPVGSWQPGDVVRHQQLIQLPELLIGEDYEIVVGLWFDQGELVVNNPQQFLGEDVIRIATITVHEDGRYEIFPRQAEEGD